MKKKKANKLINYLRTLIYKILILSIIFLLLAIFTKSNQTYKDLITTNIYENNFSFTKIKKLYNKYLGGITPLDKIVNEELTVFNEELTYDNLEVYHDGIKLEVETNYLVPVINEGMVVFIGEKENYGNVIIIEDENGIDIWYGNMDTTSVKLYDYVAAKTYLGTLKDNYLYLVFKKDDTILNYEEYLK